MKNISAIITSILFSGAALAEVDYSICLGVSSNAPIQHFAGERPMGGGSGTVRSIGDITFDYHYGSLSTPFTIKDGKVEVNDLATSNNITTHEDGRRTYEIEYIATDSPTLSGSMDGKRTLKVVIEQGADGVFKSVTRDRAIGKEDLNNLLDSYFSSFPPREAEKMKKLALENPDDYGYGGTLSLGVKDDWEVVDGQCVVTERNEEIGLVRNADIYDTQKGPIFNAHLCNDLEDFFEKNPEVQSCFKNSSNKQVADIFESYYSFDEYSGSQMASTFRADQFRSATSAHPAHVTQGTSMGDALYSSWATPEAGRELASDAGVRIRNGMSPVIAAHSVLQDCFDNNLHSSMFFLRMNAEKGSSNSRIDHGSASGEER